ncbi:hypothetical protein VQ7734_04521 [Vibrio quintilis]|uniref:Uncharacterized protein n=1 Tax=Vibrio quintilis TaxID=1117707 RepID=A0A1M7Z1C4_9VIBR|nr:hypothetical protein VQ7734_04521 [Vibrio quintilis]
MLLRKRRTVDQILASFGSGNCTDDFPSLERLKLYEQWKSGTAQKILDGVLSYQEQCLLRDLQEVKQAIYHSYKRKWIWFFVKVSAIFAVNVVVYVIQLT